MKDLNRLLKESLSFSKFESVRRNMSFSLKEDKYMKGLSKILIFASIAIAIVIGAIVIFQDKIFVKEEVAKKEADQEITITEPEPITAVVSMALGDVKIQTLMNLIDAEVGYTLKQGDVIITEKGSECELQIDKKILVKIGENTKVSLSEVISSIKGSKDTIVDIVKGTVKSAVGKLNNDGFKIRTSTAVAAVRGTKFLVAVDDKGTTKVIVSEGKVSVGVRSKSVQNISEQLPETHKEKLSQYESVAEKTIEKGEQVIIKREQQEKVDSIIEKAISEKENPDKIVEDVSKAAKEVSKKVSISETKASKSDIVSLDKSVSKDMIVVSRSVKITFIPTDTTKDSSLYINNIQIATSLPVTRILEADKNYQIRAEKDSKVLFSKEMSFAKDTDVVIQEVKPQESLSPQIVEPQVPSISKLDFGINAVSGYGRWAEYDRLSIIPSTSGVSIFDGDNLKNINIRGISYGFGDNIIVALSKDENEYLQVKIANTEGKILQSVNLGESTKGTLVVSRPAVLDKKAFVPSIDGLHIIDSRTGEDKVVKIGSIYSDVAIAKNRAIAINEIGEVYSVSSDGSYTKVAQLSSSVVRKASVSSDGENVFIYTRGKMTILNISKGKETATVNLPISKDTLPIIYKDNVIVFDDKRILILTKNGSVENTITLNGTLQGTPYVGNDYIVATTSQGTYLYNLNGSQVKSYDEVGNASVIINNKLFIIGKEETVIKEIK
ncbi:MAG: FecR domain-containing protein [Spirochaetia bacterium]|nr:FecR domain-containing protein [Spirochaetota bacterium]MCX8096279.1 FecR domain-containing protein [Spirochaetota bacterium]MDW8112972.1 FecR domain-containing protein [Spirochaetia bacterium]